MSKLKCGGPGTGTNPFSSDNVGSVSAASSYNLIGTGGLTNMVNNNLVGVTSPGLAPALADNGGPTQTIALLAGSPAIGAGSATIPGVVVPLTDQRGQPLDLSLDIGAYPSSGLISFPLAKVASTGATPAFATVAAVGPTAVTPSIVSSPSAFKERKLHAKAPHHKVAAASHAKLHHQVHAVAAPRKTPKVRIVKHHR